MCRSVDLSTPTRPLLYLACSLVWLAALAIVSVASTLILAILVFVDTVSMPHFDINYLCTYDLYSPVQNVLDACVSITMGSGRGLGPGILEFFGPCEIVSVSSTLILAILVFVDTVPMNTFI